MIWKTLLFTLITLVVTGLLASIQQLVGLDYEKMVLPQWAPAIGFFMMAVFFRECRTPIVLALNKPMVLKSLLALVLPFLFMSIAFAIGQWIGLAPKITNDVSALLSIMLLGVFVGAIGEEIGWRSFLQAKLEKNNSAVLSSIIVGTIWGLWHMGHYQNGLLFMLGFLLFTIAASIILAWILRGTRFNIILSVLFHVSINIGFVVLFKSSLTDAKMMIIHGVVWLISAMMIVILTGKRLVNA